MARVITFVSAAKGVGKTYISANLALQLGRFGFETCLLNADSDAGFLHRMLDVQPEYTLEDLIRNRCRLNNIVIEKSDKTAYFPGFPGINALPELNTEEKERLLRSFLELNRFDFFLVDTFPGLSRNVSAFCRSSREIILVMTPESDSLKDSEAFLKALAINGYKGSVSVLINKSLDVKVARRSYETFKEMVRIHPDITLLPLGTVFSQPASEEGRTDTGPVVVNDADSDTAKCIANIAQHLIDRKKADLAVSTFWTDYLTYIKHPLQLAGHPSTNGKKSDTVPEDDEQGAMSVLNHTIQKLFDASTSSTEEINRNVGEIHTALNRFMEKLDRLSLEIEELKKRLFNQQPVSAVTSGMGKIRPLRKSEKIPLDFEAYLRRQSTKK